MFDQAQRSIWLEDQLWHKLREAFPQLHTLPESVLITVGYPASGARGRSDKIKPCEVNYQWQGNVNEKAFVSVHPAYFTDPSTAAKAILFGAAKVTGGARWGASKVGVSKDGDGALWATPECQAKLDAIIADIGEPPAGFGVPFPMRTVQRARLRKYICADKVCGHDNVAHPIIRSATDKGAFTCTLCDQPYMLVKR